MTRAELVPIEQVRAGDVVRRPSGVTHVATRIEGPYEDGTRVLVYASYEEATYEWKARDRSGFNLRSTRDGVKVAVERSFVPMRDGVRVQVVERGRVDLLVEALRALEDADQARPKRRQSADGVAL